MCRFRDERGFCNWNRGLRPLGSTASSPTRFEGQEGPESCQSASNTMLRIDKLLMRLKMTARLLRKMFTATAGCRFPYP